MSEGFGEKNERETLLIWIYENMGWNGMCGGGDGLEDDPKVSILTHGWFMFYFFMVKLVNQILGKH